MTKHVFRLRGSVMVVKLNTPQNPSNPGSKASTCCMFLILLKMPNTNYIEGSTEDQIRKAQISDFDLSYMKRILTLKSPFLHLNRQSYSKTIRNFISVTDPQSQSIFNFFFPSEESNGVFIIINGKLWWLQMFRERVHSSECSNTNTTLEK